MSYKKIKFTIMSKAQRRADTKKWKKKRKDHAGDKCSNAKCGICSYHKLLGNSKKGFKKNVITALQSMDADEFYNNFWYIDDEEWERVMRLIGEWDYDLNDLQIEILEKMNYKMLYENLQRIN